MNIVEFDYFLPSHLIAQYPANERDMSRLLVLHRGSGRIEHRNFKDIVEYLLPDDVLILNDTKVIPARLFGKDKSGKSFEVLLVKADKGTAESSNLWEVLIRPARKARIGLELMFSDELKGRICEYSPSGQRLMEFSCAQDFFSIIEQIGHMPLPPYIKRMDSKLDQQKYQTTYAANPGAIAAPTAGLHFTHEVLSMIRKKGVKIAYVTLHIGLGTFKPVKTQNIHDHQMEAEYYAIPEETMNILKESAKPLRVIAVGTTSVRTIESFFTTNVQAGWTDIFIYPGYEFKRVDALITNLHTPHSTPLMLTSAFAGNVLQASSLRANHHLQTNVSSGRDMLLKAYQEAIEKGYRFYSYGDSMLIV
ncbi:MAG: tRNA preQ1(34) S-adenosylmethionine ribosyltransferase-isomerase QueA [bacterium]|nr:tRNA preQ1(34) S-adenosylmethionine ribosyltransferase-isomerase QueA [bacterium]